MRTWLEKVMSKPVVRKVLIAAVGSVLFYILFGFLALPPILKSVLSKNLTEALHRNVVIREIRVNPLVLSISIRGFTIAERDEPKTWVSAEEVFANLQLASVIRGGPVFSEVRIIRPYVNIIRHPDGSYNFTDLMGDSNKRQKERSSPFKYSFNNIQLADGSVDFDDAPKGTRHEIRGIQVGIPFLSNLRHHVDLHVKPSFAAVVNGKQISIEGKSKPFSPSLETTFALNISDLDIPHYLAYVPLQREYEVLSAFLDVKAVIHFTQHANRPATLTAEGDVTLKEVRVSGKDGRPMIHLPKVKAAIFPSDLAARDFHLTDLEVEAPEIDISIDDNKKVNLLSLLPEKQKDNSAKEESSEKPEKNQPGVKEPKFTVDSIRLTGGKVRFSDTSRGTPFRTQLGDLRIDVDRLGTAMGTKADTLVSFTSEAGEKVEQRGDLSLSPLGSEGTVSLEKIVLKKYAPYYADAVRFDIDAGTLDARSSYKYSKGEGGDDFRLAGLEASASGLRFRKRDEKEEFLVIPGISLKEGELDLGKKEVTFGLVSTAKGSVFVRRSAGGEMNVARLLPEGVQSTGLVSTIKAEDKPDEEKTPEKPWGIIAKEFLVDRYSVSFEDRTTDPPVEIALDRLRLKLEYLTTDGKKPGKISFSTGYNRQGTISLGGTFTVDPPSMNARLRAKSLPIGVMQPYYSEKVKILLTSGTTSAEGNVSVDAPKGKPVRASFRGELFVNDFSSLDKAHGEDFLKFANLHFGGVDVEYNPTSVAIREIALTDFYSRIIVQPDGTLNVQGIVAKDGAGGGDNAALKTAEPPPADNVARAPAIPVRIDNVTLQGGAVNFSDRYIKPNYSANLVELGGSVSGLSSEESGRADVNLRGKLGNSTPLEIVGKINPLAKDLFLDFKVDFRDMDLSTLSTYSGRYAGYGIQKGKLTLNLKYHIEKKKLDSENKVFLDQFTFGDAVDSPDATKLPVRFAVSLLKDRNGEIHLDLPVTGSIDDPKFSVLGVVWQIVKNLLVKAATSPFALLGAAFGGGEELSYVEFDPGSYVVPPPGIAKLGNLVKVLAERPALKLEIEGHVDPDRDKEALLQKIFRGKVAAQKVKILVKSGQTVPATDNVRVDASEYPKFLTLAYKEEKFPKPRNFIGIAKDLPVPEMEKLMLTNIQVGDDELRELAHQRASRVRDQVLLGGKVDPGRVFLVEPKSLAPEKKEKLSDSRVDFRIQ